ncbi:uncharacterized protein M6B38_371750 [Iris pallida]|nr:uncharacterized protein M6B38_371750 [Iris pallida]
MHAPSPFSCAGTGRSSLAQSSLGCIEAQSSLAFRGAWLHGVWTYTEHNLWTSPI